MTRSPTSLAGPQPYEGNKREFPQCVAGSLRVRVGIKGRRPPESDGRIPPRLRGGGGQSLCGVLHDGGALLNHVFHVVPIPPVVVEARTSLNTW